MAAAAVMLTCVGCDEHDRPAKSVAGQEVLRVRWTRHVELARLADIDATLDRPVVTANGREALVMMPPQTFRWNKKPGPPVCVTTVRDYLRWRGAGYGPADNYQIAVESWFAAASVPVRFFKPAKDAQVSYVSDFDLTSRPLALPAMLGPFLSPDEERRVEDAAAEGKTWRQIWPGSKWQVHDADQISVEADGLLTTILLLGWGDFDHDGVEDILLHVANHATQASFRSYRHVVVTRRDKDGPMEIVSEIF